MKFQILKAPERNQYLTVWIVNIVSFIHGNVTGWFSPALVTLSSQTSTPLTNGPITPDQISWVAASLFVGGWLGLLLSGPILCRFGYKVSLVVMGIPHFFFWALVAFGDHYWYLIIARIFAGYTGGNLFKIIPAYVAEISQSNIRGKLGSLMPLFYNAGILLGFILGSYVPYKIIPVSIAMSVLYIITIILYVPETPQFLLIKGDKEKAHQSLIFYRTGKRTQASQLIETEFADLTSAQTARENKGNTRWWSIFSKEARFGLWMSVFLASVMHCSGFMALIQFTATIFEESGSSLPPNEAAIIVAALQTLGCYASSFLVERFGRKILLLFSCSSTAISLGILGSYSYLDRHGFDVTEHNWIPIVSFAAAIFLVSLGVTAVSLTIMTEILLPEVKNTGLTIVNLVGSTWGFTIHKVFPVLLIEIHVYGVIWIFGTACVIGLIVCSIFLPETKGKNLNKVT